MSVRKKIVTTACWIYFISGVCEGQIIIGKTNEFHVAIYNAVKIAACLRVGMSAAAADAFLENHGISGRILNTNGETLIYSQNVGDNYFWGTFYPLDGTSSLELNMRQRDGSAQMMDGTLERAYIQSNGVNIIVIALTPAPKGAESGIVGFDLRGVPTSENLAKYISQMAKNNAALGAIIAGLDDTNVVSLDHGSTFIPVREICATIIDERFGRSLGNQFYEPRKRYQVRTICSFQDEHGSVYRYHICIYDESQYYLMKGFMKKKLDSR